MAFTTSGVYTQVTGAVTATAGQVIASATWDAIHTDIGNALQAVMGQLLGSQSVAKNIVFGNGGFEVWQRTNGGATASVAVAASTTVYTADRWYLNTGANQASIVSAATALEVNSTLACKIIRNSGQTGVTAMIFGYPLDSESVNQLRSQKVVVGFWAKSGANFSPASGTLTVQVQTGTAAPIKFTAGYAGAAAIINSPVTLTTTSTYYSIVGTVTAGASITQAELLFTWTPTGTAGADDSFTIDSIQMEVQAANNNTGAPTFTYTQATYDHLPYSVMYDDCVHHFQKTFPYGTAPAANAGVNGAIGVLSSGNIRAGVYYRFNTPMRNSPTVNYFCPNTAASSAWTNQTGAVTLTVSATATSSIGIFLLSATVAATDQLLFLHLQADAGI